MRIVSLLPSATETLCALGLADKIVGISHKCDYPDRIINRSRLTRSVLREDLPSEEIHRRVQAGVAGQTRLYELDRELLARLRPDLIVTQEQCSVCAIGKNDVEEAIAFSGCNARVVVLRATHFDEVMDDIAGLGLVTEREDAATALIGGIRMRIHELRRRIAQARRPKVFCLSWFNPLMAASHWMTEIIELAGGVDGLGTPGVSAPLTLDRLRAYNPGTIFLMPCDFSLERTIREWQDASLQTVCRDLTAVWNGCVYAVKGSLFHRPGPRLIEGVELLASILHPLRVRRTYAEDVIRRVA